MTVYHTPLAALKSGVVTIMDSTHVQIVSGSVTQDYYGTGVTYGQNGVTGGTLTRTTYSDSANGGLQYEITGLHHSAVTAYSYVVGGNQIGLASFLLAWDDTVTGSPVDDTLSGYGGNDALFGGAGNDNLSGGDGNDTLTGGVGNDTLQGGAGANTMLGGSGDDVYVVGDASHEVTKDTLVELAGGGNDTVQSYLENFTLPDQIEVLLLQQSSVRKSGTGNGLPNQIVGTMGGDILNGGAGDDTLEGGLGNDVYVVDSQNDIVIDTGGRDTIQASIDGYVLTAPGIEELMLIGTAISAFGDAQRNFLFGNAQNNRLWGGAGDDAIYGGAGTDIALYSGLSVTYTLQRTSLNNFNLTGIEGTDHIFGDTERIRFSDRGIALDLGVKQAGGQTALLIGAILGKSALAQKPALVGAVLDLFDQSFTLQQLSGAVMRLDIWGTLANSGKADTSNTQIATYLLTTVNKTAPTPADLSAAVAALNSETGSVQGNFLWHLAESAANQTQVGLTGLAATGLEFTWSA